MKSFSIRVVALAAGALVAGSAFASVNLDTGVTTGTFASELNYSSAGTAISGAKTVSTKLGFGVSGTQDRYIRVDLVGAKLAAASIGVNAPVNGTLAFANSILVAGGAVNDTYAIYQVTAAAGGHASTDAVSIALPNLYVTNGNAASVSVTYTLYETATAAVANAANTNLYSASGALLKFGPGLKWALTPSANTAAVSESFKKFNPSAVTVGPVAIGKFAYDVNAVVVADGTTPVALADLVTAATKAVFTGDFGAMAANGVFVDANDACVTVNAATVNVAKNSADYTLGTAATTANLCYKVTGTTAVPVQTVNAALDLTAAAGSSAADVAAASIGTIDHDGTELQAPWFSTAGGYISRFVLTSTHTADAGYTAAVITETGNVCTTGAGATGTIPAGKQLVIAATDVCTALSTNSRAAVVFTIAAPTTKIQGVYNIVNATTGSVSVSPMVRPGTN
jgi:hypothetical protein